MQLLLHFYRERSQFWLVSFCSDYLIIVIVIEKPTITAIFQNVYTPSTSQLYCIHVTW